MKDILKIEHIAESISKLFFEQFKDRKDSIEVYDKKSDFKRPVTITYEEFMMNAFNEKQPELEVESQYQLNDKFELSKQWKEFQLKVSPDKEILIDPISNLDNCLISKTKKLILPIEVKSGSSKKKYASVESILKYSYFERQLKTNKKHLSGDIICILSRSAPIQRKKNGRKVLKDLKFEKKYQVLVPKACGELNLTEKWILVVKSPGHVILPEIVDNDLTYIITLHDMVKYLYPNQVWDSFRQLILNDLDRILKKMF